MNIPVNIQTHNLTVKRNLLSNLKMSVNLPQNVVNAGNRVIDPDDKFVKKWVGIGWINLRKATKEDYLDIPEIVD